jgi:hypothetical protein
MKSDQTVKQTKHFLHRTPSLALLAMVAALAAIRTMEAATNVVVWDTGSRFGEAIDVGSRAGWKAVPSELFVFEAEPAKAASDPGYYGQEYSFKGDAVVENHGLVAFFLSAKGTVALYSKTDSAATISNGTSSDRNGPGKRILEFFRCNQRPSREKLAVARFCETPRMKSSLRLSFWRMDYRKHRLSFILERPASLRSNPPRR